MTRRLLDFDPNTGMKTFHHYDEMEEKTVIEYEQDVAPIIDRNKRAQNEAGGRMGEWEHVASIPNNVIYEWLTKYGINFYDPNHKEGVKRLLNSSDYRWLKTREIIL